MKGRLTAMNIHLFKLKRKKLKYYSDYDIMTSLKGFGISEGSDEVMGGLVIIDKDNIQPFKDNKITFKVLPEKVIIFESTKEAYNILKSITSSDKIICRITNSKDDLKYATLDSENYKSVQEIYNRALQDNMTIKNDKELIKYAVHQMQPSMKFVKVTKQLGKEAFPGSKVKQYKLKCLICYYPKLVDILEPIIT